MVKVILASHLGRAVGLRETELAADSVGRLLRELSRRHGKPFDDLARTCKVIVNGTNVAFLAGESTRLAEGDEVILLPPLAGG
jgi:molybdopterin converting factor small subunit